MRGKNGTPGPERWNIRQKHRWKQIFGRAVGRFEGPNAIKST